MQSKNLKLAYISPLPPEKSGISFYSKELLPYLSRHYQITLVIDQEELDPVLAKEYEVIKYEAFPKSFKDFDRILCNFGNSPYHKHMIYLIEEIPSVLVLHDVLISSLINWAHHTSYYPNILIEEAYYSHGWTALLEMKKNLENFIMKYPLNARVINNSLGVIVHNKHALDLVKDFYSEVDERKFDIIPHIRKSQDITPNRKNNEILICSFGYVATIKKPDIIIKGFALSEVSKLPNAKFCFVGEPSPPELAKELLRLSESLKLKDKVVITGFADNETYRDYLKNSLICIQLRSNSKGETSGTVLDVLAHGKPLIVNAYGSFKELPNDACYFVSEYPKPEEIAKAIDRLYSDENLRAKLSKKAINYIKEVHSPEKVAEEFYDTIERFYKETNLPEFLENMTKVIKEERDLKKFASLIKKNFSPIVKNKTIFVDVSAISVNDLGTGIERVVKAQLKGLIENPPKGFRIEPVRLIDEDGKWKFKYARNYAKNFLGIVDNGILTDAEVDFHEGDIYYVPDYAAGVTEGYRAGVYDELKLRDVKIAFLVHDMLPVEFPKYFPPGASEWHAKWAKVILDISDLILCVSNATAESMKNFAKTEGLYREGLKIEALHHGSDIKEIKHKEGLASEDIRLFNKVNKDPYFLMVSTIEPRKGHFQTIKAFEMLWKNGYEVNLAIVGKQGWMVEDVIDYINNHSQLNKRLFWLGYVSDDLLEKLYSHAMATIVASEGEGFGLSIIESANYKTPVIVRDIPVFKEVAKEGAYYFPNTKDPKVLAKALEDWLKLYKENKHPKVEAINCISWKEHTEKLKEIILSLAET